MPTADRMFVRWRPRWRALHGEAVMGPGLGRRVASTMAGQGTYVLTQFLILIVLARLGTVSNIGQFGLAMAIVTPVYWLTDLGLRTNKMTDASAVNSYADLRALRLVTSVIGFGLIAVIGLLADYDRETTLILLILGAAKGVECMSDIAYGTFERHGRMVLFARSIMVRGVAGFVAFTIILATLGSAPAAFLGPLTVWTLVYLFHDEPQARKVSAAETQSVRWSALPGIAFDSRHLGAARFLAALSNSLPRIVVERLIGLEALGLFTAIAYILQAALVMVTAVSRSVMGHLADLHSRDEVARFRRIITRYTLLTCGAGLLGVLFSWLFGEPLLTTLFGAEFLGQRMLLVLMMLAATFRTMGIVLQAAPLASRTFRTVAWLRVVDLVLCVSASLLGAVVAGLEGVAVGIAVSAFVQVVLLLVIYFFRIRRVG